MRLLTNESLHRYWACLPKGSSLVLIVDADHGTSVLPVSRRLDSGLLPALPIGAPVVAMTEPLCNSRSCTVADMKHRLREASLHPRKDPLLKARDAALQFPEKHFL